MEQGDEHGHFWLVPEIGPNDTVVFRDDRGHAGVVVHIMVSSKMEARVPREVLVEAVMSKLLEA